VSNQEGRCSFTVTGDSDACLQTFSRCKATDTLCCVACTKLLHKGDSASGEMEIPCR
jgi:hypothetical protein